MTAGKAPHKERAAAGSQALFPSTRTGWGRAPGSPSTPLCLRALAPSVISHTPPAALPASPLLGALAGPSPSFPVPCPRGVSPCPSLPGAGLRGAPPAPALCAAEGAPPSLGGGGPGPAGRCPPCPGPCTAVGAAPWPCGRRPRSLSLPSGWCGAVIYLRERLFAEAHPPPPGSSAVELGGPGGLCCPLGTLQGHSPLGLGSPRSHGLPPPTPWAPPNSRLRPAVARQLFGGSCPRFGGWWVGTVSAPLEVGAARGWAP